MSARGRGGATGGRGAGRGGGAPVGRGGGGRGGRGGGGYGGKRAVQDSAVPCNFRINMSPIDIDTIALTAYQGYHINVCINEKNVGVPGSVPWEGTVAHNVLTQEECQLLASVARSSEKKGRKVMDRKITEYLQTILGDASDYSWDGGATVWTPISLPVEPKSEPFSLTGFLTGADKKKVKKELQIDLLLSRSKSTMAQLTRKELELRLTHIIKSTFSSSVIDMGGLTCERTNAIYPYVGLPMEPGQGKPETDLYMQLKDITDRITANAAFDAKKLGPLKCLRGFDLSIVLLGNYDDTKDNAVKAIQEGVLVPHLVVTAKTGVVLNQNMTVSRFIEAIKKSTMCRDDRQCSEVLQKRNVRRNYGTNNDNIEIVVDGTPITKDPKTHKAQSAIHDKPISSTMFTGPSGETSVMEYTNQKFNIKCNPSLPPVAVKGRGREPSYLPQDHITLNADFFPSFGNAIQGCTTNLARTTPTQYKEFYNIIASYVLNPKSKSGAALSAWGVKGSAASLKAVVIKGMQLCDPIVMYKNNQTEQGAGMWNMRGKQFLVANPKPVPIAVMNMSQRAEPSIGTFIQEMKNSHQALGMSTNLIQLAPPAALSSWLKERGNNNETLKDIFGAFAGDIMGKKVGHMYCILPDQELIGDIVYRMIKITLEGSGVVTQCCKPSKTPVLNGKPPSPGHFANIAAGLNTKMGGINHVLKPEHTGGVEAIFGPHTCYVGIDLDHGKGGVRPDVRRIADNHSVDAPRISTASIVMTIDKSCTKSKARCQVQHFDPLDVKGLDVIQPRHSKKMFEELVEIRMKAVPTTAHFCVIRDGVDSGSYGSVIQNEIQILEGVLKAGGHTLPNGQPIPVSLVCCMKRHGYRLFPEGSESDITPGSCAGVSIGDELTMQSNRYPTWYSMAHHAIPGSTPVPLRCAIIQNPLGVPIAKWAQFIYASSHLDQVVQKTVSLPFPALYAHKTCERGSFALDTFICPGRRSGCKITDPNQITAPNGSMPVAGVNDMMKHHFTGIPNSAFL